jgi:sRNA-binding regulator protein Hfq
VAAQGTRVWHAPEPVRAEGVPKTPRAASRARLSRPQEPDELLRDVVAEIWFVRAIEGLPQPLIGRVLQVGKYLITVETRNGQAFRIYKHALAAMRPVSHEARDVRESQLRTREAVQ